MSDIELESLDLYYQMKALTKLVLGFGQNDVTYPWTKRNGTAWPISLKNYYSCSS